MPNNQRNYVPRPPRHTAATSDQARLDVWRCDGEKWVIAAELIDFSRQGLRFHTAEPFELGERLEVRLSAGADYVWQHEATVRWCNGESFADAVYGCVFDQPIGWEVLGELLLRGVLSSD